MENLESQVAKIQIGNFKQTSSYVLTFAEKAADGISELYAVVELPMFNPAAIPDCERITQAVCATLQRAYKRGVNESTFEAALGEINEELGKLATLGQTNWIGKLNSAVAVKTESTFNIATTGKVTALLFRENEFTDITDSPKSKHPLKTFENFATGRLRVNDMLVLSTSELFNHLSIDRLKNVLTGNSLHLAAEQVVKILEENAGPETAFGTLLLYESTLQNQVSEAPIQLAEYLPKDRSLKALLHSAGKQVKDLVTHQKVKDFATTTVAKSKQLLSKRPNFNVSSMAEQTKRNLQGLRESSKSLRGVPLHKFTSLSRQKKIFIISAIVLLLAVIVNISLANKFKSQKTTTAAYSNTIQELKNLLSQADSNLLFQNKDNAKANLNLFTSRVATLTNLSDTQKKEVADLQKQADELTKKLENIYPLTVTNIGSLSASDNLIALPGIFATEMGDSIVSYNVAANKIEDGVLKTSGSIVKSTVISASTAAIFNGQGLALWDFSKGTTTSPFYLNVPKASDLVGLVYYQPSGKIYLIDKAKSQVISFTVTNTVISKPAIWSKSTPDLGNAVDMTIDGNIYVLNPNGVNKYTQGKTAAFSFPQLSTPLSGKGKIYTNKDIQNIYILDSGNKRIVVLDKKGSIVKILQNDNLTNPTDFSVDEKNKTFFILNNGSLYKATY